MKGKCFRCASADHFANYCFLAKDIKCKRCSTAGHISAACTQGGQTKPNTTGEQEEKDNSSMLPLEYRPASHVQDKKFAESRAVGGACFAPLQPAPFPS